MRHAQSVKERSRTWKQANPAKDRAASLNWRKNHPDRYLQNAARYRARKRAAVVERVDYEAIIERDNRLCHICGDAVDLSLAKYHPMSKSFDHVIPLSKGGSHSMGNVKLAHFGCNSRKGAR
jgi:5-methylcytosine-specific restriction endonuclease McrA